MTDTVIANLTLQQKSQLQIYLDPQTRNYPAAYRLILSALPTTGDESLVKTRYWFAEAANINENNGASAANIFIRAYTKTGLAISLQDSSDNKLQATSNLIAETLLREILINGAVSPVSQFLHHDISQALSAGGQSIGGWAGAAFFWNEPYRDPATQKMTTVGALIQRSPDEMSKFLLASAAGLKAVALKIDFDGNLTSGELPLSALVEIGRSFSLIPVKTAIEILQSATALLPGTIGQQFLQGINLPKRLIEDMQRGIRQIYGPVSENASPNPAEQIAGLLPQGIVVADANNGGGYGTMPDLVAQRVSINDWVNEIGAGGNATLVDLGNGAIAVVAGGEVVGVAQREGFQLALNHGNTRKLIDANGAAISTTQRQIFDDGSTLDTIANHITGLQTVKATDALNATREATLPNTTTLTPAQQEALLKDHLYSGATSFFNALRTGDKLGQLLSMGQMVSSFAKINGGNTAQFDSFLGGATAGLGILSALNGLQSTDLKTQLNSAANLLRSADTLATLNGSSFLSAGASQALSQFGAVLSIANLGNVGQMLENGQLGTAIATTVNAINAGAFLAGAGGATSAFGAGAFIPMDPTTLLVFVVATAILDEAFKKTPPPPPPVGQATLKTLANGSVGYDISNAANGGAELLTEKMNALVAQINAQLDYANGKVLTQAQQTLLELTPAQVAALPNRPIPAADQMLTLVASRAPKIYIQSWPAHAPANLSTNYFFGLESKHPQTGQSYNVGLARQDLVRHYAEALVHPQALVAQWEVTHLTAKYGSNQTLWKTEGQWASGLSAIEAERLIKQAAVTAAQGALANAQKTTLTQGAFVGEGEITGNTFVQSLPDTAAVQAAQAALAAAQGARAAFEAENPGKLDPFNDKQGSNPQAAAHIVDAATIAAAKNNPANEALQNALIAARTGAAHQWVKVIALDWGGDGITKQTLPGSVSQTLQAVQTDGVARFDVDNDGYREATEWLAPSEAILGLDRDNNGALDTANELFNGVNTPFDQRGWASLKYYDSNNDGKITEADPVYQQLRLWFDLDGNGSAGDLEVLNLGMKYVGIDTAALSARLDAIGQAALAAMAQTGIASIDLATLVVTLKNGATVNASEQKLQSETKGIAVVVDQPTQNVSIIHEDGARENYITVVEDMSVLMELQNAGITAARRTELEALAVKYGLNPQSTDFMKVVKSLRAGGENMGGTGQTVYIGNDDVWVDAGLRTKLEQMRFKFDAVVDVGGSDVFGTATLNAPEYAGPGSANAVVLDPWAASVYVNQSNVTSNPITTVTTPRVEQIVLTANVYTLDVVVKGAQLGGLATQQAVLVSDPATGQTQTVQMYTTTAPTVSLTASTLAGREDERFGFSYLQLELEARAQIGGAATVRLIGMRSASHGYVEVDEVTGRAVFIPDANYFGNDAGFTYLVMDNLGRVMERRVNINLSAVNDAPTLRGETIAAKEDVPLLLTAANLLANDVDLEGDTFRIIGIGRVGMGDAQLLSNGDIRYLPPADLYGVTDTIEYLVQDSKGATAVGVVKITLSPVDDAPTVVSELLRSFDEDTNLRIDPALLLANDFDPDFNRVDGASQLNITAVGNGTHGSVYKDVNGDIIFVPDANFNGKATFTYTVTDSTGLSTQGTAEVEIAAVNDAPTVAGETINSAEDTPLRIDPDVLLFNDRDADILRGENQTLKVAAADQAVNGTVTVDNGLITFTPTLNFSGTAGFRYAVSDGVGGLAHANVTINVAAVNDAPQAPNRSFGGTEDTPLMITSAGLLAWVVDVESGTTGLSVQSVTNPIGGTLVVAGNNYTFTPAANYNGLASFDYSVRDAGGAATTAKVTINLNAVNDAPVFIANSTVLTKQGEEDSAVRIAASAVLGMFADVDGDTITLDAATLSVVAGGDTISFDAATSEIVFKAAANANGIRQFNVRVKDSNGAFSAVKTLGVDFKALNDTPIVNSAGVEVVEDGIPISQAHYAQAWSYIAYSGLLAKASDVDGDALYVSAIGSAWDVNGHAIGIRNEAENGRLAILPSQNYSGPVAFGYTISDGNGGATSQVAYGNVVPVNDTPYAWVGSTQSFGWVNGSITGQFSGYEYFRIDAYDVEQAAETLAYSISRYPLQTPLWQGIATWGQNTRWTTNDWDGNSWSSQWSEEYYAAPNNFAAANYVAGGGSFAEYVGIRVADWSGAAVNYVYSFWSVGYDPIIIDLQSDGLDFIGLESSQAKFDRDGNGTLERTAWVKNTEAILAWDHNADGQINRIDEIEFWSHVNSNGVPLTDMQSLGRPEFDATQDGKFDALDPRWAQFKFWRDLNEDGKSQAGELQTMAQAGVKALHLHSNVLNRRYESGVVVRGYSRLEMTDGRMLQAGDVQFLADDPTIPVAPAPVVPVSYAVPTDPVQAEAWFNEQAALAAAKRRIGNGQFTGAPDDQRVLTGNSYSYQLPTDLLPIAGAGQLTRVTLANGDPLPSWLQFNPTTGVLAGTAPTGTSQDWHLKIERTAGTGTAAQQALTLTAVEVNQAPLVHGKVPTQFAAEKSPFSLDIAPNFFMDLDVGDALRLKATLANGAALPSWLQFDAANGRFYGTPQQSDVQTLAIKITAIDEANASAVTQFNLVVAPVNDAPVLNKPMATATMKIGQATSIVLPYDMFVETDVDDSFSLSVSRSDGTALPSWLAYNAVTRTFSGTPTATDLAAPVSVRVTATDLAGARTSTIVTFTSSIFGTTGNDVLTGTAFNEDLFGDAGNDSLDGKAGNDAMVGGVGNDTYYVDAAGDLVFENANEGTDTVWSQVSYTLGANQENLVLDTAAAVNGTGNTLDNYIYAGAGNNILVGGTGTDWLDYTRMTAAVTVNLALTTAQVTGGSGTDTLSGFERLYGSAYNDTLLGDAGANYLAGYTGADSMNGGAGDDVYFVDNAGDVVTELAAEGSDTIYTAINYVLGVNQERLVVDSALAVNGTGNALNNDIYAGSGNNILDGGAGVDFVVYDRLSTGGVTVSLALTGPQNTGGSGTDTLLNFENLQGSAFADVLTGDANANYIRGLAGNDVLDGGAGIDTLVGDAGDDTYVVDNAADVVTEAASSGLDTVQSSVTYTLAVNVENLTLTGNSLIDGTGNVANNVLTGNSARNLLDGGAGNDTLIGGGGDDYYFVDAVSDVVVETAGGGTGDIVETSVSRTIDAEVEGIASRGAIGLTLTGDARANTFHGYVTTAGDTLVGLGGNDSYYVSTSDVVVEAAGGGFDTVNAMFSLLAANYANVEKLALYGTADAKLTGDANANDLVGNSGNNLIDGAAGNDTMAGGTGNDTYVVDSASDVVTEALNEGTDTVQSSVTLTLAANVENLTLTGAAAISATGNAMNNTLVGNTGINTLNGGAGADTMAGGAGDDVYYVDDAGDVVTELANEGTVDIIYSSISYTLGANQERIYINTSAAVNATGNELTNYIYAGVGNNVIDGGAGLDGVIYQSSTSGVTVSLAITGAQNTIASGTDTLIGIEYLYGSNYGDNLTGNALANVIQGYAGADTMAAAGGDDSYYVDNLGDVVIELVGEGSADFVYSTVNNYILAANVERLYLFGAAAITGTGNALNNVLYGDDIYSGIIANTLIGGAGDDSYYVAIGDSVVEAANEGVDLILSNVNYTLGVNQENLTAVSTTAGLVLTGNTQNNTITGGTFADTIEGGLGDDLLNGAAGTDTLSYASATAGITLSLALTTAQATGGAGTDTVSNFENLTGSAFNDVLTGDGLNNLIQSGAGNDALNGGAGSDTLAGGGGDDTYYIDSAADVVVELAGGGTDFVYSTVNRVMDAEVEALVAQGAMGLTFTGDSRNNTFYGWSTAAADTFVGATGDDVYYVAATDMITELAGGGTDQVRANFDLLLGNYLNVENAILEGTGNWSVTGNEFANVLIGNVGNNTLTGGLGNDTMAGGAGNDTYVVDSASDVVTEALNEGADTVQSSVTLTLAANVENLTLTGAAAINATGNALNNALVGNSADNILDGGLGIDTMTGGAGNDVYYVDTVGDIGVEAVGEGVDQVVTSVNYTLGANLEYLSLNSSAAINGTGNELNNSIYAGAGNNIIDGGAGTDFVIYSSAVAGVTINLSLTSAQVTGGSGTDTVLNIENIYGSSFGDNLTGNASNNEFRDAGGADTMSGGNGDDIYYANNTADVVIENANEGYDIVYSNVTYTLSANVDRLYLYGTAAVNATGNTLNNVLYGGDSNGGNTAANVLTGGVGDDTYYVGLGDSVVEVANEGVDHVLSYVDYILGANQENLTAASTTAGLVLTGNTQNNSITGGTLADTIEGGLGDDLLNGAAGTDTLSYAAAAAGITMNLALTTAQVTAGAGTDTVSNFENLTGSAFNDTLTGDAANNTIQGGAGIDWLDGSTGIDTLVGGVGDDIYIVDNVGDLVTEDIAGGGNDGVYTTVNRTIDANVEYLRATGAGAITLYGDARDNVLYGWDTIAVNTLIGGDGSDHYRVGAEDLVVETATGGFDYVRSMGNLSLANYTNIEAAVLEGTANTTALGTSSSNSLFGNTGANTLNGGAGNDYLEGRAGGDTYLLARGHGIDTIYENETTAGVIDIAQYDATVAKEQLWFRQVSNDLEVSVIGTTDKINIANWYLGSQYRVEQFKTSDGKTLLDSQVQNLVSAMAAFAPPSAGQTTLPTNYATSLQPVIAANWV